jgi:hypothetical protein
MIPASMRVPVPFEYAFAHGALALGVAPVTDFDTPDRAQARDKETGQLLWSVSLMDLDPDARRFGRHEVKVKIASATEPVLPPSAVPGYPAAVELVGLVLVPYTDSNRCRGNGRCGARLAYSMRADTVIAAGSAGSSAQPAA